MPKSKPKPRAAKLKDSLAKLLSEHSQHKKKPQPQGVSQTRKSNPTKFPSKPFCPPYTATDRILLVGEGNFSFARALAEHVLGTGENLVATCLDSEEVLMLKYEDEARANVEAVVAAGGTVLYEVDATKLNKCAALKGKRFEKIVFNFPHAGGCFGFHLCLPLDPSPYRSRIVPILTSSLSFSHCRCRNQRPGP